MKSNGDISGFSIDAARGLVEAALREDVGQGDVTSRILVGPDVLCSAVITVKEPAVLCGLCVAEEAFKIASVECGLERDKLVFSREAEDGTKVSAGTVIAGIKGSARAILMAERTALNFLQHLCGVATLTRQFVDEVEKVSPAAKIYDTRKTMPMLRYLQRYAVRCGGGYNHRLGLWDMVLVKDNHHKLFGKGNIVDPVRKSQPQGAKVEVEIKDLSELKGLLMDRADIIMLDNMSPGRIAEAMRHINGRCEVEVSGGVNIKNVKEIAKLGVNRISIGALTHSARAIDIGMDVTGL
jgi:nicotinate-nucleotide pyrophosphorylase (carboxylating)